MIRETGTVAIWMSVSKDPMVSRVPGILDGHALHLAEAIRFNSLAYIIDKGHLDWNLFIRHRDIEKNTESMTGLTETRDNPITSADSVTKIEAGDELSHMEDQKLVLNHPFS